MVRPTRQDPNEQRLLERIFADCRAARISIKFQPTRKIGPARFACSGYFDGERIAVAHRNKKWFEVLVHEYCHLLQQLDGNWLTGPAESAACYTFDQWIMGKSEPGKERILECTRTIQALELDCERRVVRLAKQYQLPWDLELYKRQANVYVFSYECSRLTRKWERRRVASRVPELLDCVSSSFVRRDRVGYLPDGFLETWIKKCV